MWSKLDLPQKYSNFKGKKIKATEYRNESLQEIITPNWLLNKNSYIEGI